jgi:hypothetical protein
VRRLYRRSQRSAKHWGSIACNASRRLRSCPFLCPRTTPCDGRCGDAHAVRSVQTSDDQEFLMNTQDIVETWRQAAIQEGLEQGERKVLLRLLRRRFGPEVDGEIERRVAAAPAEQVEVWAERVLSAGTLAELLAD